MARRSGESWDSMRIDIGNFSSDLGGATTESSLKKILNQVRQNTDATIREAKTFIDTETGRVIQEIFAPKGTFGNAIQVAVKSVLENTRNFPDRDNLPQVTFGSAQVNSGTKTFHGKQAQARAAFEAQQAGGFIVETGEEGVYRYAIPNQSQSSVFKTSSRMSRQAYVPPIPERPPLAEPVPFHAPEAYVSPFSGYYGYNGGTPRVEDYKKHKVFVQGEEALRRAIAETEAFGGFLSRDNTKGMHEAFLPEGLRVSDVYKGTKQSTDIFMKQSRKEAGLLDADLEKETIDTKDFGKTPSQRGFIDKAIASFTSIHILTSTAKSILSAVMSLGTRSYTEQREALALGLTPAEYRNYSYLETAKGLGEGTFTGAMGDIQNAFGNITNLDQGALESLALVMGGQVAELVNSGMGGKDPEALMKAVLDSFASRAAQGRNSVGQYVGQEDAIRELSSYLGDFSKDMETIFLSMWQDRNRMGVTGTPTFAGFEGSVQGSFVGGVDLLGSQELGRDLSELSSAMSMLTDFLKSNFALTLSDFVTSFEQVIANSLWFLLDEKQQEKVARDAVRIAEEDLMTQKDFVSGAAVSTATSLGLKSDNAVDFFRRTLGNTQYGKNVSTPENFASVLASWARGENGSIQKNLLNSLNNSFGSRTGLWATLDGLGVDMSEHSSVKDAILKIISNDFKFLLDNAKDYRSVGEGINALYGGDWRNGYNSVGDVDDFTRVSAEWLTKSGVSEGDAMKHLMNLLATAEEVRIEKEGGKQVTGGNTYVKDGVIYFEYNIKDNGESVFGGRVALDGGSTAISQTLSNSSDVQMIYEAVPGLQQ